MILQNVSQRRSAWNEVRGINGENLHAILRKYENAALIAAQEIHALRRASRIKTGVIAVLSAVCAALILCMVYGA